MSRAMLGAGTPNYFAPEVLGDKGAGYASDFWTLGILIFDMLTGLPPFCDLQDKPWATYQQDLAKLLGEQPCISVQAKDLISKLLNVSGG